MKGLKGKVRLCLIQGKVGPVAGCKQRVRVTDKRAKMILAAVFGIDLRVHF